MKKYLFAYGAALLLIGVLDAIWLGWLAADFYQQRLGHLMAPQPRLDAAAAFYLLYPVGLLLFAVRPALAERSAAAAAALGAGFGFFAYATYDLTNMATLRDWPLPVTIVDIAWGTALSALVAWLAYRAAATA